MYLRRATRHIKMFSNGAVQKRRRHTILKREHKREVTEPSSLFGKNYFTLNKDEMLHRIQESWSNNRGTGTFLILNLKLDIFEKTRNVTTETSSARC